MFVIAYNHGEGYSPPVLSIPDRETALVALEFLRASGATSFDLFEVPEWPAAPCKWWEANPIQTG